MLGWTCRCPGQPPPPTPCQAVRFTFDGQRVTGADTAATIGLEEGDALEVFQEQQGGAVE